MMSLRYATGMIAPWRMIRSSQRYVTDYCQITCPVLPCLKQKHPWSSCPTCKECLIPSDSRRRIEERRVTLGSPTEMMRMEEVDMEKREIVSGGMDTTDNTAEVVVP